ncbi:MAG: gliding motility-associated C-terminal domain-containing protein [Chitinophagales bacterium]|nr:gliding motility-associated C-terminal domain-containing protein [Chitinophagales bacterium]
MKLLMFLLFNTLSIVILAQTSYNYTLDDGNIYISPIPSGIGIDPPVNYNVTDKPLIAETYASNSMCVLDGSTIHSQATGVQNVFFGGDSPDINGKGNCAIPLYTKQVFSQSDFPILLESNFFSFSSEGLYNEGYFWIGDANYETFCGSSYYLDGNLVPQEGIRVGGTPTIALILNQYTNTEASYYIVNESMDFAEFGNWYNAKVIFDTLNNNLIVRSFQINNQCVLPTNTHIVFDQTPWLNNFRLALCVDDLAHDFHIRTNYNEVFANFTIPNSICVGECLTLTADEVISNTCTDFTYSWKIDNLVPQITTGISRDICFDLAGTYTITLTVYSPYETVSNTQTIAVVEVPLVDLGADISICSGDSVLLSNQLEIIGASYLWTDGSTNNTLMANTEGVYWLEVNDQNCIRRDSIFVNSLDIMPSIHLGNDTIICKNTTVTLDATVENANSYVWQDGSTSPLYTVEQAGMYTVSISNDCGVIIDTIAVAVDTIGLKLDLGNDQTICAGDTINLDVTQDNIASYLWQDNTMLPIYTIEDEGLYVVEVYNNCFSLTDSLKVSIENCCKVIVPNAFSPNNDEINEEIKVLSDCKDINYFDFRIYDRWGMLVFSSNSINKGWNGLYNNRISPVGVYVWTLDVKTDYENFHEKGNITLIR